MLAALERGVVATWTALELKKGIDRRLIEVHFSAFPNTYHGSPPSQSSTPASQDGGHRPAPACCPYKNHPHNHSLHVGVAAGGASSTPTTSRSSRRCRSRVVSGGAGA